MSYARFGSGGIYLFEHVDFGNVCWNCSLRSGDGPDYFAAADLGAMLAHVAEHRNAGEPIAEGVEQTLRDEWDDE